MPNHFLTVGLCAQGCYEDSADSPDLTPLKGANLCDLAYPMPPELAEIRSALPVSYRVRYKPTGEFLKNGDAREGDENSEMLPLTDADAAELLAKYGSVDWYAWCNSAWGTKWGTYHTEVFHPGGDGSPVLLAFQTAWGPVNHETMSMIEKYLSDHYLLTDITWIYHQPYDCKTGVLSYASKGVTAI